jgi:acyl-CoA synthetase (AMP-forming)/AMP-acid ligase II
MSTDATTPGEATGDGTRGDLRWASVPALVRDAAERHGTAEAVVDLAGDEPVRLDWPNCAAGSTTWPRALIAAGVEPGDRVAIWAPNCWEWVVALLGLQSAGAVLVPLNTRYKGAEAADILARSRARLLFTVEGFLGNDYVACSTATTLPDTRAHRPAARHRGPGAAGGADHARRASSPAATRCGHRRRGWPTRRAAALDGTRVRPAVHLGHHRASPRASICDPRRRRCGRSSTGRTSSGLAPRTAT